MGAKEGGRGSQSKGKTGKDGKGKGAKSEPKGGSSYYNGGTLTAACKKELKDELMVDMAKLLKAELATAFAQQRDGGSAQVKVEAAAAAAQGTKKGPWDCSACGTTSNWGNKLECRECGAARMEPIEAVKKEPEQAAEVVVETSLGALSAQREEVRATMKALEALPESDSKKEWLAQSQAKLTRTEEEMRKSQPVQVRLRIAAMEVEKTGKWLSVKEEELGELREKVQLAELSRDEAFIAHTQAEDNLAQASAAVGQASGELDALTPEQLLHALCKSVMEKTGEQTTGKSKAASLVAGLQTLLVKLEGEKAMDVDPAPPGPSGELGTGKGKGQGRTPSPEEVEELRAKEEKATQERQRLEALAAAKEKAKKEKDEEEEAKEAEAKRLAAIADGTRRDRSPRRGGVP